MGISMKVHQLTRGFWEHEPSLSLGCSKRLRPLAPKLQTNGDDSVSAFNIKPECSPRSFGCTNQTRDSNQVEANPGGTRWNPTQEQIGILEMFYKGGLRTPNAQQIEQITAELGKYGKIEGKNVFYWFQNHKARERQKQKRNNVCLGLSHSSSSPPQTTIITPVNRREIDNKVEDIQFKRKCRSWAAECFPEDGKFCGEEGDKTLELFPLHPEGR